MRTQFLRSIALLLAVNAAAAESPASQIEVGGKALRLHGPATCTFTAAGSIFDVPAAIWSVQQPASNGNFNFSVFKLKSGAEQISLFALLDGVAHQVSTVKIGANGKIRGAGVIRISVTGSGGVFHIDASTDAGVRIKGTITCAAFASPQDNG